MGKAPILIDDDVRGDLEREASLSGSTASSVAQAAIEAYLRLRTAKRRAIEEATAEAEEGRFVSKQAVDRWVASWGTPGELPEPAPDVFKTAR
jgi:predicted transcriptional regulator